MWCRLYQLRSAKYDCYFCRWNYYWLRGEKHDCYFCRWICGIWTITTYIQRKFSLLLPGSLSHGDHPGVAQPTVPPEGSHSLWRPPEDLHVPRNDDAHERRPPATSGGGPHNKDQGHKWVTGIHFLPVISGHVVLVSTDERRCYKCNVVSHWLKLVISAMSQ